MRRGERRKAPSEIIRADGPPIGIRQSEMDAIRLSTRDLLGALLRYGTRHGLPNIGAAECAERLATLHPQRAAA
ncbi:hypothetical protein [Allosphingosinicella indica]|uniref:Uncharacterized protein n=1 Tax=Allosphingosinicella indica TaxID=941907 RepID=A0A1X7GJ87_9SPHN|nr:hypothetical protein [Allosphingosinicella indica]SMF70644.1 hypothetical protein SAMN06295910_1921 [Allosphingosinicella indica]